MGDAFTRVERVDLTSPSGSDIFVRMGHPEFFYHRPDSNDRLAESITDVDPIVRRSTRKGKIVAK